MIEARSYSEVPEVDFDSMPELCGYTDEPDMYACRGGKRGYLDLLFELDSDGKSILRRIDRRSPLVVHKALYFDAELPDLPCVYILSSGGPNIDGDRYAQNFLLKEGSMASIGTGAATKLAEMERNYSGMKQSIVLEAGSYLEYRPEPVYPCRHARYISDTSIVIDPSATLFYSEIYMPGRKYYTGRKEYRPREIFEYDVLSVCTHAERPDGEPLFREKFIITPHNDSVREVGIMAQYDVFGNVIVLTPVDKANEIYDRVEPFIEDNLAMGITRLPNAAGLLFKVLGMEPGPVKGLVRDFCSTVRQVLKGRPLPPEFPWR